MNVFTYIKYATSKEYEKCMFICVIIRIQLIFYVQKTYRSLYTRIFPYHPETRKVSNFIYEVRVKSNANMRAPHNWQHCKLTTLPV